MAQNRSPRPRRLKDEEELEEAYFNLTGRKPQPALNRSSTLIVAICALLTLAAIVAVVVALNWKEPGLGPVEIGGLSMNGMDKEQAAQELQALSHIYESTAMQVLVMDQSIFISPDMSRAQLDISRILQDADSAGSTPTKLNILDYLTLDEAGIWQQLLPLEEKYGVTPSKTQWAITGADPDPSVPSDPGSKQLAVTLGVADYGLDTQKLYQLILRGYQEQNFVVTMECSVVEPEWPDLQEIYSLTCTEAQDALLDENTFQITPEVPGYGFDMEQARLLLESCQQGQTVQIPFLIKEPQLTAQMLEDELYGDILGIYKTAHTNDANRNVNLRLACQAINGLVILPGKIFSFNDTLGERTESRGYKPADAYRNGLTVKTVGGGICQVSSTLYYACLLSGMKIQERYAHSFVSSYSPKGLDAAVSWGTKDFRFQNPLSTPIRLEAWMEDGSVYVSIHGQENRSYYIELYSEELATEAYDVIYQEFPPDNSEGYTDGQMIITPYTGCTVKSYRRLISRETGKTVKTEFVADSVYQKRDKVICLIVSPTTPPQETLPEPTTEPTPEVTQAAAPESTPENPL